MNTCPPADLASMPGGGPPGSGATIVWWGEASGLDTSGLVAYIPDVGCETGAVPIDCDDTGIGVPKIQ